MINRSRRSTVTTALMSVLSVAVMNARDEASFIGIAELHFVDGNRALARRGAFRRFEDEPSSVIDRHLLSVSGDRIFYRFERDAKVVAQSRSALETVNFDVKWDELWFEKRAKGRCQNFERQTASLARADFKQRVSLRRRSFFIHKQANCAVALVDCARPFCRESQTDAVERQIAVLPALDFPDPDSVAKARGWRRGEFARASIVAITRL